MKLLIASCLALLSLACGACYTNSYPLRQSVVEASIFKVYTSEGQGTGWVVADGYGITAGHVCASAAISDDHSMWAVFSSGRVSPVEIMEFETSSDAHKDACVFKMGISGRPLILLTQPPNPYETLYLDGYPNAVLTHTEGRLIKDGETTVPADHGVSGGPVYTSKGVYMIMNTISGRGTTYVELNVLLHDVGVTPTLAPEFPDNPWE